MATALPKCSSIRAFFRQCDSSDFFDPSAIGCDSSRDSGGSAGCDRADHRALSDVAYKDGQPTPAAHAFAKKAGVDVSQLEKITTSKGEYLSAKVTKKGRSAAEILAENLPKEISVDLLAEEYVLAEAEREVCASGAVAGGDARRGDDSAGV